MKLYYKEVGERRTKLRKELKSKGYSYFMFDRYPRAKGCKLIFDIQSDTSEKPITFLMPKITKIVKKYFKDAKVRGYKGMIPPYWSVVYEVVIDYKEFR